MRVVWSGVVFLAMVLSGCVATAPVKTSAELSAEKLARSIREVRDGTAEGNKNRVGYAVEYALDESAGPAQMSAIFSSSPRSKSLYLAHLDEKVTMGEVRAIERARTLKETIERSRQGGLLTSQESQAYLDKLATVVATSNAFKVSLLDVNAFPQLNAPDRRPALATQSVIAYKSNDSRADQLLAITGYIKAAGIQSPEGGRISRALLDAGVRRSEISVLERELPQLAESAKQSTHVKASFSLQGGDRLLADDVKQVVQRRTPGVIWTESSEPGVVQVRIERVRHEEKTVPERRDTITYSQHQVNIAAAVLLMPRNASYIYDVSTSGSAIEYGYVIKVEAPGIPATEKVVRGTAEGLEVRCSNARIQNVFGGVQAAEFVANDDMASRCRSGNGKSMSALRADVYDAVADAVRDAPPIRRVIDLD